MYETLFTFDGRNLINSSMRVKKCITRYVYEYMGCTSIRGPPVQHTHEYTNAYVSFVTHVRIAYLGE